MSGKTIRVTLRRSLNGRLQDHRACAHGLGLRKPRQSVEVQDTQENRGMIRKIEYMLDVQEL